MVKSLLRAILVVCVAAGLAACRVKNAGMPDPNAPECVNNAQCIHAGSPVCDPQVGKCFECVASTDCPTDSDCKAHACVPSASCAAPADCSSGTVCDLAAGRCVQCLIDGDCTSGQRCIDRVCRAQCVGAADCASLGQLCDLNSGTCVACLAHKDCPLEQYCSAGVCQPDECQGGETACIDNGIATCKPDGEGFAAPQTCIASTCVVTGAGATCTSVVPDSGTPDGEAPDATTADAATTPDAHTPDAHTPDTATTDSAATDAHTPDAHTPDAAATDAAATDAATPDAGTPDAGTPDAGTPDAGGPDTNPPPVCETTASDFDCTVIPRFPIASTAQILDGADDEFAAVRPVTFTAMNAPFRQGPTNGSPPPLGNFPEQITFRAAWSPEAFHLHVRVTDTALYPNTALGSYYNGDMVDLLISSTDNFNYGGSNSCSPSAMQLQVLPTVMPLGTIPASGSGGASTAPSSWFATRILSGQAYEIEYRIPWQSPPGVIEPGSKIGFYLGVSIQDQPGTGRQLWVGMPFDGTISKLGGGCEWMTRIEPWCDGRAWCRPTLSALSCP